MNGNQRLTVHTPAFFQIRVQGILDSRWSDRLGNAIIKREGTSEAPITVLSGRFQDQAALLGILNTLYDLGLPLLSYESKTQMN